MGRIPVNFLPLLFSFLMDEDLHITLHTMVQFDLCCNVNKYILLTLFTTKRLAKRSTNTIRTTYKCISAIRKC